MLGNLWYDLINDVSTKLCDKALVNTKLIKHYAEKMWQNKTNVELLDWTFIYTTN